MRKGQDYSGETAKYTMDKCLVIMDLWWWSESSTAKQGCSGWPQVVVIVDGRGGVNDGFGFAQRKLIKCREIERLVHACVSSWFAQVKYSPDCS